MTKCNGEAASYAPSMAQLVRATVRAWGVRLLPAALLMGLAAGSASSADRYWDPNGTAAGRGGTGAWNTTGLFWSPNNDGTSGPYTFWSNGALDDAIFGDAVTGSGFAGTVTLGVPITVHNMTFEDDTVAPFVQTAYSINGSTLTLGGVTPTINVIGNSSDIVTINSVIAGTAGLTKTGGGFLTLNGANTFSGGITLSGGRLTVNGDAALGSAANGVTMATGTALASTGALGATRVVTVSGQVSLVDTGAGTTGVGSARFTGTGGLNVGSNVKMTNDANDYTGTTVFTATNFSTSTYSFSSIADLGVASSLGAPVTVANGTITVGTAGNAAGVANYTGDGDSSNRNWQLNTSTFGPAYIRNNGTGLLTLTGNIAGSGGNQAILSALTNDLALSGVISTAVNAQQVTFEGGGLARTITVTGANTYAGQTNINAVTVRTNSLANSGTNSGFGTGSTNSLIAFTSGALSYFGAGASTNRTWLVTTAGNIRNDGTGALTLSGGVAFDGGLGQDLLTLGGSFAGVNTVSGVISSSGNVIMDGAGTWVLAGANTYTGSVTVQNGTLRAGSSQAFGAPNAAIVNGGVLDLGGNDITFTSLASAAGSGGQVQTTGTQLTVNGTASTSFGGDVTGSGGLTKLGTSTLTLTGANSYTGNTTVGGGTLALNFAGAGGPAGNIVSGASTLNMAGGKLVVTGAAGEANTQTFNGLNVTAGSNKVTATSGASGGSITVNLGAVNRTGGLIDFALPVNGNIKTSSATLGGWATVNGTDYAAVDGSNNIVAFTAYANKDNAALWLNGDVVSDTAGAANTAYFGTVSGSKQLGGLKYTAAANSTVTVGAGNTLGVDGAIIVSSASGTQTITGGNLTGGAGGSVLGVLQNGGGSFIINSTIVDNGGATTFVSGGSGAGQVTLNGANTYTGATTLSSGILNVNSIGNGGAASAIGASSAASSNLVIENGTLRYTGASATSDRGFTLVNGGPARTIDVTNAAANLTFTGLVTSPDDAGLTKAGAGTLTLANAANDYVGVTTVTGGTLSVNTLANGGVVSGIGASSSASANLVLSTGGTLQYTGATVSTDRGFTLGSGVGAIDVSAAATTLTASGVAAGAGTLNKNGAGTLVLSGINTYTGGTTVNAGVLRAGSAKAFGSTTAVMTVNTGATLDLNNIAGMAVGALVGGGNVTMGSATLTVGGNSGTFSGTISGTGGLVRSGGGAQGMSGCNNTYTGVTSVIGGTLSVDCLANGGQASGIGASGAASGNLVIVNATFSYTGGSVTTDRGFTATGGGGANSAFNITDPNATLEFTGVFAGSGSIVKGGAGTLMLSGANTYSGTITVGAGIVRAGSSAAFGTAAVVLNNTAGVTLDVNNQTVSVTSLAGGGTTGGNVTLGSGTLTIANPSGQNYAGAISGTGGLVKNGNGAQTLSGCNSSYTGTTTVNAGTLAVSCLADGGTNSSIGASSAAASNLVINGGTLQYVGAGSSTNRLFTLGPSATSALDASGTGAVNFTNTGAIAFSGVNTSQTVTLTGISTANNSLAAQITNNGLGTTSLTKSGSGTWILKNSASTYTGVTTINGGVLGVDKLANGGQASSIGQSSSLASNLVIGTGSTLRYTGAGDTTDRLFTLSTGSSFIESSGTGAVVFSNTAAVTQTGNGDRTIALGGTNTGLNTMGGAIANGPGGVTTLAKNDSGTWALTGNNTFTGNTVINDGNLMIGNGGTTGNAGAGNVIVNAPTSTLSINRSDTFNFTGTLSGPGSLAQIGTGTTVLTSVGNVIGATSVNAGTLQVNGVLSTATIAMNGAGTLTVNGTVQGPGATPSTVTGDAGASTINVNLGGTLLANGDLGGGNDTVSVSGTLNTGAAALNLGAGNDTLVLNDAAAISGVGVNAGTGGESGAGDTLRVVTAINRTLQGASVSGFESLDKQGIGTLTLYGDHSYSGGTTIQGGVLQVGNGPTAATLNTPTVVNNGALIFALNNDYTFAGTITGSGKVSKTNLGTTTLTADNSYAGSTNVLVGTLIVDGNQSGATGVTIVGASGTLGGKGTIGGSVNVSGALAPGAPGNAAGTLTINGNLGLTSGAALNYNFGQANVAGGAFNDLVNVGGNLTLDGTLNVTQSPGGTFGPGVYRVINYGGTLTNNGLNVTDPNYVVQTSVANQVNLVNSAGLQLSYWDGDAGPHSNSIVNGGNGTWRAAGDQNWTDSTGLFAAPFANASFAIFQGAAGTVTVDNTNGQVQAAGMQFATNGYLVQGGPIELVGGASIIRVGDGTGAGAAYVATINSSLTGNSQLVKTDLGTLVLSGTNSYTGGTSINGGTVRISQDANLGNAAGGLSFSGGTLNTIADITSGRAVTLAGAGTFLTNGGTTTTLTGGITGAGGLTKDGAGTLVVAGDATHSGGTTVTAGILQVGNGATAGTLAGNVTNNAVLAFNRSDSLTFGGAITGTGAVRQIGTGTTVLTANSSYSGGTTISAGTLQLGNGGSAGSFTGDVTDNGTLAFNRSDNFTFGGTISGTGGLRQVGSGTTILTANNIYTGATVIDGGTLLVDGDQSAATGLTAVNAGGTLGGTGIIGSNVFVFNDGALNPGDVGATPGTLTINGGLSLLNGSTLNYNFGQANVPGGAFNDLTEVGGDLILDGTLNVAVSPGGTFGPGIYRVISYDGALFDHGLNIGTIPSPDFFVQTSIDHQVNLVNTAGLTLNYWDGAAGPKNDGFVNGGDGLWQASAGNDNWTDSAGIVNAPFTDSAFAIFAGAAGTVSVDNSLGGVSASGMQFATGGYVIQGQDVALVGPQSIIRVGDGTAASAAYSATISSNLTGNTQLVKTDLGTLLLAGTNSYTGGTAINGGTLQVSDDGNLGAAAGALSFDGGTLRNTAAFSSARDVTLNAGGGTFETNAGLTLSGLIGGAGGLTKTGGGALTLTGANSYTGPTTVSAGSLFVNGNQSGATGLTSVQSSATLGGTGTLGGDVTIADGATLSPGAADGTPGTLAIAGNLSLSGGSILNYSFGQANVAGGALNDLTTVGGNLVLDGTLNVSVSPGGTFGPGVYRVFNYNGTLTNNGLSVGSIPSTDYFVQTAIANQVNLVNTEGLTLNYWDGAAGPKFNGVIDGGDGVWQNSTGNDNWADSTGAVNAPFTDSAFAIFAGAAGTVTVDNGLGQVAASGMQFLTDGYVIQGGPVALAGGPTSTIRVGDGTAAGAGITATIAAQLIGNTQLVKTDLGTLVLTGTNSYTGGTAINGGTLQVSADGNLGDAAGALAFNGGTLHTTASFNSGRAMNLLGQGTVLTDAGTTLTWDGTLAGAGTLTKSGTGTMAIASDSSGFAGTTSIDAGTLAVSGSLCGIVNVNAGGRLQGTGTVCDTNNFAGGVIAAGNPGVPGTLTVAGNYVGNGGVLEIETVLGGDASPTDKLVVTGNTSGATDLKVVNLGGGGAQTVEGIKVVDIGGASNGTFSLVGDYVFQGDQAVVGGAYAYRLYKNGVSTPADGDWYLRSALVNGDPDPQPLYSPGVPLYEAYEGVLQAFNELGTMQQRIGNRSWGEGATPQGADLPGQGSVDGKAIWARIEAAHAEIKPETSTSGTNYDVTTWKLQAGVDGLLHESDAGTLIGGITAHYGTASSDVSSIFGAGSIAATGYGVGSTLTWFGSGGFYVDAQAEATWYDSDIRSATLGTTLADGNNGFGYGLSVETGQKIALNGNWSLTPQAQLAYSSVDFDAFTDPFGAVVSPGSSNSLVGRLGLSADYEDQWVDDAGQVSRTHIYGLGNLYYDFLDGNDVDVSGTKLVSENQALWGGVGLGGSLSWADGRYAVFGEGTARTSLKDFGDSHALGAKLGFAVKW
ncbi:autotransporter-associated beta strand repeat-containing protein [Mesorhizobium sp. M1252]|uniref:autotransporter-associated beta strand repeat-containing protein n=1 Tax=Mesorhizobium sp. M1252 TaxID=2957073 RepID=UPI00333D57A9